ncbi:MAG: hypothetical protein EZS28_035226 [Streblomastix strix]|uniref:Uncharacterized protein n=1 Tax=Streblomastix strix TaxID=222440 RepID=A0A5J4UF55_9EUKA|nr:MAG: hypothetical protein EZS28_035226 [Streblomastix strix]
MDKDDVYSIKEYLYQILKLLDETQDLFNMIVTLNDINNKLDRMIEQTTDKPSHQSTKIKHIEQPTYKIKADNDKQLKQDDNKYIDEAIYSDIEGEPSSRFTYAEIQQMRRKQYEKENKCQLHPSIIVLESDLIKEAKYKELMNKT